jgi:hypothetical protein
MTPTRSPRLRALLLLLGAAAIPGAAHAQTIQGRVVDSSGQPVSVALLTVLDASGAAVRTGLSGDGGAFSISTGRPGRFTIRVERIGFETYTSPPVELAADERRTITIPVAAAPVVLAAVRAEGTRRCLTRPRDGGAIARLWDEARKALEIAAAAERGGAVPIGGVRYVRELDASGRRQIAVQRRSNFTTTGIPFDAVPLQTLSAVGFAVADDDRSTTYFGPSAAVLLSDPFLDRHCFTRIVEDRASPGRVGLGFEPVRGSPTVGLAGTMWLDRQSAELHAVEYEYRAPAPGSLDGASGRIDFARLPNGLPYVSRWWIRMPLIMEQARGREGRPRVIAQLEEGGIVLDARGTPVNAGDDVLAALNAALEEDERFVVRAVGRAAIDSIARRNGTIEDALGRLGELVRVERGRFWSYDHGPEEITCVEEASALPRSRIAIGGVVRREAFCDAILVYLDGEELDAPGIALRGLPLARLASIEFLGAEPASQRLGTRFDEPVLVLTSR